MKILITSLLLIVLFPGHNQAQTNDLVRIRSGHNIEDEFPRPLRWHYAQFQLGNIAFKNGKITGKHYFNYDRLLEMVMIIQPNQDTMAVTDLPDYKYFLIQQDTFYHVGQDRYLMVLAGTPSVKLAVRETYQMKRRDKKVDDGYTSFVDQTNSVRSLRNQGYARMVYDQDLLMGRVTYYHLIDKDGVTHHASKSQFIKAFPERKKAIQKYLDNTGMDFRSRPDLMRLFEYCAGEGPPGSSVKAR